MRNAWGDPSPRPSPRLGGEREFLQLSDSAEIAQRTYAQAKSDLTAAVRTSENARRLLAIPELRDDVAFCLQRDIFPLVARMEADGAIRVRQNLTAKNDPTLHRFRRSGHFHHRQ